MEKIHITKHKIFELAEDLKSKFPFLKIYFKINNKNKTIILKIVDKKNLSFEEIKTIEIIVKTYFEDYSLKILE